MSTIDDKEERIIKFWSDTWLEDMVDSLTVAAVISDALIDVSLDVVLGVDFSFKASIRETGCINEEGVMYIYKIDVLRWLKKNNLLESKYIQRRMEVSSNVYSLGWIKDWLDGEDCLSGENYE